MFIELQYVPACLLAAIGGLRVLWVPSSAITRNMAIQATCIQPLHVVQLREIKE